MARPRIRSIVLAAVLVLSPAMLAAQQPPVPQQPTAPPTGTTQQQQQQQQPQDAQAPTAGPMQPGMLLAIGRMEIKPGKDAAVEKLEHAAAVLTTSKMTNMPRMLAMNAVAGPSETWFLVPLPSYAALDKVMEQFRNLPAPVAAEIGQLNEQEGNYINSGSMMICRYLHDYSNGASSDVSAYRYVQVMTYRVRPGKTQDFLKGAKFYTDALKKGMPDERWAMFALDAGGYQGTFMVFVPLKKLADLTPDPVVSKAVMEAMGGPEGAQKLMAGTSEVVTSISTQIFAFNPAMSSVAPLFAKSDPWWAWKAGPTKTAASAKPGEKKKAQEPAIKK